MESYEYHDSGAAAAVPTTCQATEPPPERKPLLSGPKRQHFLPRFYLDGFADDGKVAVYDREANEVRVQQPINTGVIGHFYTMVDEQGRKRYELEQLFSEYEGKAKPVIDKLAAREEISADERSDMAIFIALGTMRTPDVVDSLKMANSDMILRIAKMMYSNVDQVVEQLRSDDKYAGRNDAELREEAQLMVDMAQKGGLQVTTNEKWAVGMAIQMALEIAPIFAGRDWVVSHCDNPKKSFVTTDAPVVLTTVAPRENNFWGVGYGNADALVFFPLNHQCMLAMFGNSGDLRHYDVGTEQIRQWNLAMADRCQRFVIGRSETLVQNLADTVKLASKSWRPKMQAN